MILLLAKGGWGSSFPSCGGGGVFATNFLLLLLLSGERLFKIIGV